MIATIGLFPKLHLASDSFNDFQFQVIKIRNDPALIDELAKSVVILAVIIMKMIPNVVSMVGLAPLGEHVMLLFQVFSSI